jgi:hypothetical protein
MTIDLERVRDRLERIRHTFVAQMEAWLELMPEDTRTQPFVGLAGGETLTPEDMVSEVRNGTEWGERFLDNAIALMAARDFQQQAMPVEEIEELPSSATATRRTRAASQ